MTPPLVARFCDMSPWSWAGCLRTSLRGPPITVGTGRQFFSCCLDRLQSPVSRGRKLLLDSLKHSSSKLTNRSSLLQSLVIQAHFFKAYLSKLASSKLTYRSSLLQSLLIEARFFKIHLSKLASSTLTYRSSLMNL